jgi:glycosyltransferase involved in cell wall biosynthesis
MRIIVFAYACEPNRGSEPGAGWIWVRMLARLGGRIWVVTRANNREVIEQHLPGTEERDRLHFVYVDLPYWARFWKRGSRGLRPYYMLWQAAALKKARSLHRQEPFDLAWHLTLANVWLGSLASVVGPRFVFGPIGGGVRMPWRLWRSVGAIGLVREAARSGARTACRYANPAARLAWRRASLILVQNPETRAWLPKRHRLKATVFPNPIVENSLDEQGGNRGASPVPTALFAGQLLPLKGLDLAIRAIALLPDWHLLICGGGSDQRRLSRTAERLGVDDRVRFLGWKTRNEVLTMMANADVLLFPSLHDEAGFVVVEALSVGLPVVCLDLGGPPCLGGSPVAPADLDGTVKALAEAVLAAKGTSPTAPPSELARRQHLAALLAEQGLWTSFETEHKGGAVPS